MPDPTTAMGVSGGINAASSMYAADKQAKATKDASKLQAATTREQLALQERMYDEGVARSQPFYQGGVSANNRLLSLLGIRGEPQGGTGFAGMMSRIGNGMGRQPNDPNFGKYAGSFSDLGDNWQKDPGYQFRLSEGLKALDRNAASRGGLISGNALKAAGRYGQNMASQEYQNAFNRYYAQRDAALNPLQSLAGVGQTTSNNMNAAGQGYAGMAGNTAMSGAANQGNLMTQGADARASGYMGASNALNNSLSQYMNYNQGQQYMDILKNRGAGGGGYTMPDPYTYQYGQ